MDVDGTLTNAKKEITPKTKEALKKAQNAGIKLILASGRPTSGLRKLAEQLEMNKHHGYFVSYNGAMVIDCQTDEVLFNQALDIQDAKAVLEHMKKFDRVRPMIDKGEYMYVNNVFDCMITFNDAPFNVIEYESRGGNYKLCEIDDLAQFVDYPLNKILTFSDPEYLQAHHEEMMEPFKDRLSCMFTGPFYFEFTAKGIDKAKALETALSPLGFNSEDMISFGDGQNDASIIKYAHIGVAMENAVQQLKDIADEITLSNEEDGIAHSLYKHLPDIFK